MGGGSLGFASVTDQHNPWGTPSSRNSQFNGVRRTRSHLLCQWGKMRRGRRCPGSRMLTMALNTGHPQPSCMLCPCERTSAAPPESPCFPLSHDSSGIINVQDPLLLAGSVLTRIMEVWNGWTPIHFFACSHLCMVVVVSVTRPVVVTWSYRYHPHIQSLPSEAFPTTPEPVWEGA